MCSHAPANKIRFAVTAFCLHMGSLAYSAEPTRELLPTIQQAWQRRVHALKTGRWKWQEERLYPAGTMPSFKGTATPLPPKDTSITMALELSIEDNKLRYTVSGPQWISGEERFAPRQYVSVFDGTDSKSFYSGPDRPTDSFHPLGFVNDDMKNIDVDNIHLEPLLLVMRPPTSLMSRDVPGATVRRGVAKEAGPSGGDGRYTVVEVIMQDGRGGLVALWLAEDQNWSIVRKTITIRNQILYQLDIDYAATDDNEWLPRSWRGLVMATKPLRVREQFKGAVTSCETNRSPPQAEFQFNFPPGTQVRDQVHKTLYIVRDDHTQRQVTRAESRASVPYGRLLTTEPVSPSAQMSVQRIVLLVCTSLVVLLLSLALLVRGWTRAAGG